MKYFNIHDVQLNFLQVVISVNFIASHYRQKDSDKILTESED